MRAADGAIEVVRIEDDALELEVIGDVEPVGHLRLGPRRRGRRAGAASGLLDASGPVRPGRGGGRDRPAPSPAGCVARDRRRAGLRPPLAGRGGRRSSDAVYLSQRDVRELQFAKAAIATGWRLLVEELGIDESEIQQVLLAGSFGSYLSPASAVRIGLVPKLPLPRIVSAGNVAGEGAKMALLSMQERHAATAMLDEVEYVELSDRHGLQRPVRRGARVPGDPMSGATSDRHLLARHPGAGDGEGGGG